MSTNQREQLHTQNNVEPQDNKNSGKLLHREQIENTPIWVIGSEERGYFLAIGHNQVTGRKKTIEEAKADLEIKKWDIILVAIGIITEKLLQEKEWLKKQEHLDEL